MSEVRNDAAKNLELDRASQRLLNVPNSVTASRLLAIPLFVWVLFGSDRPILAALILALLSSTDWIDGWLARKLDQTTDFGAVFDPTVDRLVFAVAVPATAIYGSIPWWLVGAVMAREIIVISCAAGVFLKDRSRFEVTLVGKFGTFCLMVALPLFLAESSSDSSLLAQLVESFAWIFAVLGLIGGWASLAFQYLPGTVKILSGAAD